MNFINHYDVLLLTETWNARTTHVNISGYESFSCPRSRTNRRTKRDSGGVIVYYKQWLCGKIELVKIDYKGILLSKLKKEPFSFDDDIYVCVCYIPPENSQVYRNPNSELLEFDIFEKINDDILQFSELGQIFLTGDTNSRVGKRPDYVEKI